MPAVELSLSTGLELTPASRRRDARALLLSALLLSLGVVAARQYWPLLVSILLTAGFLWRQWRVVLRRLLPVNVFMLFLWLTLPLTAGGEEVFWQGISWSLEGVRLALLSTLKANAIALLFMAFLGRLGVDGSVRALARLGAPSKLTLLLLLTLRSVLQLREHFSTALRALRHRRPMEAGRGHLLRGYAAVMARALEQSAHRAGMLQQIILLRGFDGGLPALEADCWRWPDTVMVLLCLVSGVALGVGLSALPAAFMVP